jgi:glycosyltransferase involved in cell wall biosynthesis
MLGIFIANGFASEARVAASLLRHRGHRYEALALLHSWDGDRESAMKFETASNARAFRFDAGWRPNPGDDRSFPAKVGSWARLHMVMPRLLAEARRFGAEIVYSSQQTWDCYAAGVISRLLRIPQIIHLHYTVGPWLGWSTLRMLRRCERVVTVSEFIRREALGHGIAEGRIVPLLNALDLPPAPAPERLGALRRELGLEPGQRIAAIVSRIDPGKGHLDTLAAFAAAVEQLPDARLLVVGEGTIRAAVEAEVQARGLRNKALLLGFRKDVNDLIGLVDVFVHPSRKDPCPLGVLEAAAAGKPVVAYADGGLPEIVADGLTGILAPTGDQAALTEALLRLLRDPELARRMGAAGRERMERKFRPQDAGARFAEVVVGLKRAA